MLGALKLKNNPDTKNPSQKLYWFQYFLLDLILVFILILLLVVRKMTRWFSRNKYKLE
jgi:flagellar biogenesis protein FliO